MQKLLLALSILLLISLPVSGQEAFFEGHFEGFLTNCVLNL